MSVPERPDENVEWAESPHAEAEEPEELRLYGWPYGFVPPSAAFNWLQRSVGRWIQWLEAKVDGHVHDGGSEPGSVAKVDVKEHLGWGEQGYLEVTSDTPDVHRVEHHHKNGNPAIAEFVSDILRARTLLRFPGGLVRKIPFSGDVEVELDEPGRVIWLINKINSEVGAEFGADVSVEGAVSAKNTARAFVSFDASGTVLSSYGVSSVNRVVNTPGLFSVTLSSSAPSSEDEITAIATVRTLQENTAGIATVLPELGLNHISVMTYDLQGDPAYRPVNLVVYW